MDLNLPKYDFKIRKIDQSRYEIFDEYRKKYVLITPEEWVRQNFIRFLCQEKNFHAGLISVEKGITVNNMPKRFDAVVYNRKGKPVALLEFKKPDVKIDQMVMEQISRYNLRLKVKYLIVSNGLVHYCCKVEFDKGEISFLNEIPEFDQLK